jgi:hypothetical protein
MKFTFLPFSVDYGKIEESVLDFKSECIRAVGNAVKQNKNNLPLVVMMSGGIESELLAQSLVLAGVPFKCVIGKLMTRISNKDIIFNEHDYQFAERWCERNSIEIVYCEVDIFKENKLLCEYALSVKGFSPQYACHMVIMKWCSDNGYFFLAGNGEMDLVLVGNEYFMLDEQREFTLDNFCRLHNLTGVWQFWKQDGRLISAFLRLPTVKKLIDQKIKSFLDHKHECFGDVFEFEGRKKTTGFEKVQEWDYIHRSELKLINGQFDEKFYTPVSAFYGG